MPIEQVIAVRTNRQAELRAQFAGFLPDWPPEFTLEIGCGHGHFLTAYAEAHPDEYCLGIDIISNRLRRAERKAGRVKAPLLHFIRAEAGMFLETLPEPYRVKRVFVLFPDPWPKRKHHKNRLLGPDFLDLLVTKVAPGARLHFRTDHGPYFEAAAATLRSHPDWQLSNEPWPFEHPTVFQDRASTYYSFIAVLTPAF